MTNAFWTQDKPVIYRCGHVMCEKCSKSVMKQNGGMCPLCRSVTQQPRTAQRWPLQQTNQKQPTGVKIFQGTCDRFPLNQKKCLSLGPTQARKALFAFAGFDACVSDCVVTNTQHGKTPKVHRVCSCSCSNHTFFCATEQQNEEERNDDDGIVDTESLGNKANNEKRRTRG